MVVQLKSDDTQTTPPSPPHPQEEADNKVEENKRVVVDEPKEESKEDGSADSSSSADAAVVEKSASYKEESSISSDLKESEKKALIELKSKLEEAILNNTIFVKEEVKPKQEEDKEKEKPIEESKEEKKPTEENKEEKTSIEGNKEENKPDKENKEEKKDEEKNPIEGEEAIKEEKKPIKGKEAIKEEKKPIKGKEAIKEEKKATEDNKFTEKVEETNKEEKKHIERDEADAKKEKKPMEGQEEVKAIEEVFDKDISLWGVPLLPSKNAEGIDVILLKFLRAREFKVNEALEMLISTLRWRVEQKIDSILDEKSELEADLSSVVYMDGVDLEGHPICYNMYGAFQDEELYQKIFGSEEKCKSFLRWRFQLMEKGIQKLDLKPGGVSSLLQINDLKNAPGLSKTGLRLATRKAVNLLQDNYPEFVARNIFVNVSFWYYAFSALFSPFLTQRTKSKFVFARPAKVTETLLKYISAEQIPIKYGGLKRENDSEFSVEDGPVSELYVKSGSTETIEIPATEVGSTPVWDLSVLGWEVNYKEEFVPTDEGSYTIVVQKSKKISSDELAIRNSFRNNEPGKIVLTIENATYKKKRILYRYKVKKSSS